MLVVLCGCSTSSPGPGVGFDDDTSNAQIAREIEEADIVKVADGYLYLANSFTGLRIIDARDMSRPTMAGGLPLRGRSVELFLRGDYAFIFTAADFLLCAGEPVGFDEGTFDTTIAPNYSGSRMWVVDVSDKLEPSFVAWFDFDGFVTSTRRVGDVVYVAGDQPSRVGNVFLDEGVFIRSFNISDPEAVVLADSDIVSGNALDIHVSDTALYVFGADPTLSQTTLVTYVDISDPTGAIKERDQFRVPGHVDNRFFVDEHNTTFRIVTEEYLPSTFSTVVALYIYDITDPDDVSRIARLPITTDESLRAVRFDGDRAYAVTFRFTDPLFVLDLSDSDDPKISGELKVPGYSTHLVPLGDRLVGVGFDDTADFRPAVSLYDVADPANPSLLSKVIVGERGQFDTTSEATVDEKAMRVLEDAGLILLPFSVFDDETGRWTDALEFIEMRDDRLFERSAIEHRGLVRRAGLLDDRVWVLSDLAFQSVDIADLTEPVSLGTLDIIDDQELLDAGLQSCADSARFRGTNFGGFLFFSPCGAFGFFSMFLTVGGLFVLRFAGPKRKSRSQTAL